MARVTLVSILALTLLSLVWSDLIILDEKEDQNPTHWLNISCTYYPDYDAYTNQGGCSFDTTAHNFSDPFDTALSSGFWGPCSKTSCVFLYYGLQLPAPQSINISAVTTNNAFILVEARKHVTSGNFEFIGQLQGDGRPIDSETNHSWEILHLSNSNSDLCSDDWVIRITVNSDEKSFALIDSIILDNPDWDIPTESPPEEAKNEFTLNSKEEMTSEWTVGCNYADHWDEFWVYGCPFVNTTEVEDNLGYWTTCKRFNCDFIFDAGKDSPLPSKVTLQGNFGEDTVITVSKKKEGLLQMYRHVTTVNSSQIQNGVWTTDFDNDCLHHIYNISISGSSDPILVDVVTVNLFQEDEICRNIPVTTTPIPPTPRPQITTTPGSGVMFSQNILSILCLFLIVIYLV